MTLLSGIPVDLEVTKMVTASKSWGIIAVALFLLTIATIAAAKYGGGSGTAEDPYQIATSEDLIALGETPQDYDKHFILTDNIDLAGRVFDKAVIAPDVDEMTWHQFDGTRFTGVFDGNGHTISHLTITGVSYLGLFGLLESGAEVDNLAVVDAKIAGSHIYVGVLVGINSGGVTGCYSTGAVSGISSVGGLLGYNGGSVAMSYSTGSVSGHYSVGGLVGSNYEGTVTQCYSTGSVRATGWSVGGLVGSNAYGNVTHCYSTGAVSGVSSVGGLVGSNGGSITTSYSTGAVTGGTFVGGLVGYTSGGVTACYSTGKVSGSGEYVGGLVGVGDRFYVRSLVTASFWNRQTSGQATSSGGTGLTTAEMQRAITFSCWPPNGVWTIDEGRDYPRLWWENAPGELITRTYYYGGGSGTQDDPYMIYSAEQLNMIALVSCDWGKHFKIMADLDLSGFDGRQTRPAFNIIGGYETPFTGVFDGDGRTISHLTITGEGYVGLFGYIESSAQVKNLGVVDVNITGSGNFVGGLVGYNGTGTVARCYSTGAVSGSNYVGGLVGRNPGGVVTQCYSTSSVRGTGGYVGGLVAENGLTFWTMGEYSVPGTISRCYSTSVVSGRYYVGGLVGSNGDGSVIQCYSTGALSGTGAVGGLVGYNNGDVTQCYSTGAVTGDSYVGGLVGRKYAGSLTGCFWDTQTSGQSTSAGGTGNTTAEMQMAVTFLEAGWDFVNVWGIGENQTYPYLRKYSAADINQDASVNFLDLAVLAEKWLSSDE